MRRRPSFWIILAIVLMMLTAIVTYVINEGDPVGLGILVLIALIWVVGVTAAQRISQPRQVRRRAIPMSQYVSNEAMRRAKYSAGPGRPDLRDIGILAYRDEGDPDVYRQQAVRGGARQLRPYVVLHWGGMLPGETEMHYVIEDGAGRTCFEVRQAARLAHGRNFITPATWLPINEEEGSGAQVERDGRWKLTVHVDGVTVAVLPFQVKQPVRSELSGAISADGEIEPESAPEWSDEPLTLKDLLAGDQDPTRLVGKTPKN